MCGIVGSFTKNSTPGLDELLQESLLALHHRGPDDRGKEVLHFNAGQLALGHTRLSVIDISQRGHQPMHSPDERYTIIFNGEIYNYKELGQELRALGRSFSSDSDTEILLAAWAEWQEECLPKLVGMFAFVVLDREKLTLSGCRDAFGIKPFFYRHQAGKLHFASEIPALLKLWGGSPEPNWQRIYDYLVCGRADDQEYTFFKDVQQLLPGHWFHFSLEKPRSLLVNRWWWPNI